MVDERLDSLERWRAEFEARWQTSFPNGDHAGHCRYHQIMIEQIEERRRLRRAVMEKSIAGLVWGGIVFLALAAWHYIKTQIKGGG